MDAYRVAAFLCLLVVGGDLANARSAADAPPNAVPLNPPGSWLSTDDYPAAAMRLEMSGITAFKLAVNATGTPLRCDITQSSGFDVLDQATCERVMLNARFAVFHPRAGEAPERSFSNRVKWVLPADLKPPVSENSGSMLLSVDETGAVTSCRIVLHLILDTASDPTKPCDNAPPPAVALQMRHGAQGPSAEIELQDAVTFRPEKLGGFVSTVPSYEQVALSIHRFTVRDGKVTQCAFEEQRGPEKLATNYCNGAYSRSFAPPYNVVDKDGSARGWHVFRVLLKTPG